MSNFTRRRGLLTAALITPLLTACPSPRLFDIGWNEEVQLHDGAVLLVTTNVQFQRNGVFAGYQNTQRRVTTLKFDAGMPVGGVTFVTWLLPVFLDRIDGKWYLVLSGQGPFGKTDESPELWGQDFTTREQRLAVLEGGTFRAIAWDLAPSSVRRENLFPLIETSELAKLNGKRVSIDEKEILFRDRLLDPSGRQITRPQRMRSVDEQRP